MTEGEFRFTPLPQPRDEHAELLRSQAMKHVMDAMGMAQVNTHGNDYAWGTRGVTLDNESQVNSRTLWSEMRDGVAHRYVYDVTVTVAVTRREVEPDGR